MTDSTKSGEVLVHVVEMQDGAVEVLIGRDLDGGQYLRLRGNGCDLAGEEPGLYYPEPRS
jgi:hypothetical protein